LQVVGVPLGPIKKKLKRTLLSPAKEYFVIFFEDDTFINFLKMMLLRMEEWMLMHNIIRLSKIGTNSK
jgi:hypothetical protein